MWGGAVNSDKAMYIHLQSWVRRRLARAAADATGVAAVEFAVLAPMLVALLLVVLMAGIIFMAKAELDLTTQRVGRLVMTGQVTTSSGLQTAICNNTGGLLACADIMAGLTAYTGSQLDSIGTATPTLTYNANGSVSNTWNAQFGSAGSIMVLQLMYQFPMISGPLFNFATQSNGAYLIISTSVFVHE